MVVFQLLLAATYLLIAPDDRCRDLQHAKQFASLSSGTKPPTAVIAAVILLVMLWFLFSKNVKVKEVGIL